MGISLQSKLCLFVGKKRMLTFTIWGLLGLWGFLGGERDYEDELLKGVSPCTG